EDMPVQDPSLPACALEARAFPWQAEAKAASPCHKCRASPGGQMRPISAPYPAARFRRLRRTASLRALTQENHLSVGDLIWPVFVRDGTKVEEPIASMPGVNRISIDNVVRAAEQAASLGIPAI
ncbi:Delta-aminolevulinic acid dehydratase-like protein, partial [Daphnia magna]